MSPPFLRVLGVLHNLSHNGFQLIWLNIARDAPNSESTNSALSFSFFLPGFSLFKW